jgi:hypothetical protein
MSSPKETDYFLEENNKSIEWYKNCFKEDAIEYGEVSPNYSKHPHPKFIGVPERMYNIIPNVKILYLVRDPLERAVSNYAHNWIDRRFDKTIDEIFQSEEHYLLDKSRYHYQVKQYIKYFEKSQILIIQSEKLRDNRGKTLEKVFDFIGVRKCKFKESMEKYNVTDNRVRLNKLGQWISENKILRPFRKTLKILMGNEMYDNAKRALSSRRQIPKLSDDIKKKAKKYLRKDAERLREFTGMSFEEWCV